MKNRLNAEFQNKQSKICICWERRHKIFCFKGVDVIFYSEWFVSGKVLLMRVKHYFEKLGVGEGCGGEKGGREEEDCAKK